jgi:hypothetical protein
MARHPRHPSAYQKANYPASLRALRAQGATPWKDTKMIRDSIKAAQVAAMKSGDKPALPPSA